MYPKHPLISSLTEVGEYVSLSYPIPKGFGDFYSISFGPVELQASNGLLNQRYWMVSLQSNKVYLYKGIEGEWVDPIFLFEDVNPIEEVSLTFDQLGRPIVFYKLVKGALKLYWFNPEESALVISIVGEGMHPIAGFDMINDAGNNNSDAMLFYLEGESNIIMLLQRDRWRVKYTYPVNVVVTNLVSCGLRKDYRFQVIYESYDWEKMKGRGWLPEKKQTGNWIPEV